MNGLPSTARQAFSNTSASAASSSVEASLTIGYIRSGSTPSSSGNRGKNSPPPRAMNDFQ